MFSFNTWANANLDKLAARRQIFASSIKDNAINVQLRSQHLHCGRNNCLVGVVKRNAFGARWPEGGAWRASYIMHDA